MAPCENNPLCTNKKCPIKRKKEVRFGYNVSTEKKAIVSVSPESANKYHPVWSFSKCDHNGDWSFSKEKLRDIFWDKVLPVLKGLETQTWNDILVSSKKQNHSISVEKLNICAQNRLKQLRLYYDEVISLRVEGKIRIYGIRDLEKLFLLWCDLNHGDNDTCVCRSSKKHT